MIQHSAILHAGISEGIQTNNAIVEANLRQVKHHNPEVFVEDEYLSYASHGFQETELIRNFVHEIRRVQL